MKSYPFPLWLIAAMIGSPLYLARGQDAPEPIRLEPAAIENLKLEFSEVMTEVIQQSLRAAGTVRLDEKRVIEVTPKISGMIVDDPTSLGDPIEKGDTLGTLQSPELAEMIANYVAAEEAMRFAMAEVEQERALEAKKLSSVEQLREKEQALTLALTSHARALQPLKLLDFNEGTIHSFLSNVEVANYTTLELKAPASGEIILKTVRRGAAVEHDQSLFTVADLSQLWVDFYVSLREVDSLETGGRVLVDSSVSQNQREAEVLYISPVADDKSRAVLVRALLENADGAWRPGTPVSVSAVATAAAGGGALAVPNSSLVDFDGGKAVFVKEDDGSFLPTPVETGASDASMTQILNGLDEGQIVVSRNAAQLKGHLEMTSGE